MYMASKYPKKVSNAAFQKMWDAARADPNFIIEMKAFVKASMKVYKLH